MVFSIILFSMVVVVECISSREDLIRLGLLQACREWVEGGAGTSSNFRAVAMVVVFISLQTAMAGGQAVVAVLMLLVVEGEEWCLLRAA